jgi:hypothetical protein
MGAELAQGGFILTMKRGFPKSRNLLFSAASLNMTPRFSGIFSSALWDIIATGDVYRERYRKFPDDFYRAANTQ